MPSLGTSPYAARADHDHSPLPAPDAADVTIADAGNDFTATEVEGALAELQSDAEAHLADAVDAHDASAISFTPNGSIAATDVQAAIVEVRDEASGSGIPATIVDAKGDLIVASAADTVGRLAVGGTDGHALVVDAAETLGVKWAAVSGSGIPATIFDVKGDLIAATAADTAARLAAGTNYKRLVAASGETTGLAWLGFIGARAYNNAAQTVTAATETTVLYNSEEYDTSAIHDTSSNTGRMTIPSGMGGYWRFTSHVSIIGTHGLIYFFLRVDGTTVIIGSEIDEATATTDFSAIVSVLVNLTAGQYVETRAYRATGTTFGNNANGTMCSMEAEFLGV